MHDPNLTKLRLIMALFRLRPVSICRATGYSKTFLSLVLAGKMRASQKFFIRLNNRLLKLIGDSGAATCVFDVAPSKIEVDEKIVKAINN